MYYIEPPEEEEDEEDIPDYDPETAREADQGLASDPAPPAAAGSASGQAKSNTQRKKFATLGDLSAGGGTGGDDGSDKEDMPQDLFAGGEKSGLAVQNPDDLKKKIIDKAKK